MAWVKLDDGFGEHPKIVKAGPLAGWLFVMGLGYCNRNLTDGFIPIEMVARLLAGKGTPALAARLVAAGLWEQADGGYRVHDYLDYQPSKEQAEALSLARAESGKKGGQAKAKQVASTLLELGLKQTPSKTLAKAKQKSSPIPIPIPIPLTDPNGSAAAKPPAPAGWIEKHALFAVAEELFGRPAPSHWSSLAQSLRDLDDLKATPDDLRQRTERYPKVMGNDNDGKPIILTLRAVIKHWHACAPAMNGKVHPTVGPPALTADEGRAIRERLLAGKEIQ